MAGFSLAMGTAILAALCKSAAVAMPDLFVALHADDPGVTGANELAGNGYARVRLAPDPSAANGNWTLDLGGPGGIARMRNNASALFPRALAPWPAPTFYGLWRTLAGVAPTDFVCGAPVIGGSLVIDLGQRIEIPPLQLEFWVS